MISGREGEASARALAEQWKVEYLEAGAITVDPRAISLLAPVDARRLRAVPLALRGSTGLIAVAAPSDERFAAVREQTGPATQFAVVSEQTLDALLASRLFAERQPAPTPAPAPAPTQAAPPSVPAPPPAPPPVVEAPPPAAAPPGDEVVNAVVAAVLERLAPPPAPQPDTAELDRTREALRATKEELAAANAALDQSRQRIHALETRLQEVARMLLPSEEHVEA